MRSHSHILKYIAAFEPVSGIWLPLDDLLIELWAVGPPPALALPVLFGVFERFPEDDGAGVFWAIVHGIEALPFNYEPFLQESHSRKPSEMTEVMLMRLANWKNKA